MPKISTQINYIEHLRKQFYELSTGKEALLDLIDETEVAEQVYNSNAIENSTLSLEETEKILLQIDLDRSISQRELFEAKNLARVVSYIKTKAKQQGLDLAIIKTLHEMLISNINDNIAGRFRNEKEWVKVAGYIAIDPKNIVTSLEKMLAIYFGNNNKNIIQKVALFHLTFESIHPFVDGNGRIGRVLNNYLLIREGYVPINIKFIERDKYYQAFSEFNQNKSTRIMDDIVAKALSNSYHKRLAYLRGQQIVSLADYAKAKNLSYPNLINKSKRQTIPAFIEKGKWKIGL